MLESGRSSKWSMAHAERGGKAVPGCAPFGLQRTLAAPRSNAAGQRRHVLAGIGAREGFQDEARLFVKLGAASRSGSPPPRKPNPAFERTAHGKPWSAAQGQR